MRNATPEPPEPNPQFVIEERGNRLNLRNRWLRSASAECYLADVLNELPGVHFIVKDQRGRIMFLSRTVLERYGIQDESEIIGLTEHELNLEFLPAGEVQDDARIVETGEPIRGRLELWFNPHGLPDWCWVTKLPIRSRSGPIIGIIAILRHYEGTHRPGETQDALGRVIDHVREHYSRPLTVAQLAELVERSPRHLERKFHAAFGMTPKQFLIRTRVGAACRALRQTQASLADIATDCGFYDQSALTQHFHHCVGMPPSQYRRLAVNQGR